MGFIIAERAPNSTRARNGSSYSIPTAAVAERPQRPDPPDSGTVTSGNSPPQLHVTPPDVAAFDIPHENGTTDEGLPTSPSSARRADSMTAIWPDERGRRRDVELAEMGRPSAFRLRRGGRGAVVEPSGLHPMLRSYGASSCYHVCGGWLRPDLALAPTPPLAQSRRSTSTRASTTTTRSAPRSTPPRATSRTTAPDAGAPRVHVVPVYPFDFLPIFRARQRSALCPTVVVPPPPPPLPLGCTRRMHAHTRENDRRGRPRGGGGREARCVRDRCERGVAEERASGRLGAGVVDAGCWSSTASPSTRPRLDWSPSGLEERKVEVGRRRRRIELIGDVDGLALQVEQAQLRRQRRREAVSVKSDSRKGEGRPHLEPNGGELLDQLLGLSRGDARRVAPKRVDAVEPLGQLSAIQRHETARGRRRSAWTSLRARVWQGVRTRAGSSRCRPGARS